MAAYLLALILIWTGLGEGLVVPPCNRHMFDSNVHGLCLPDFNSSMETSGYQVRCPWPVTKRVYNTLKFCVDHWANQSWCKGRGFLVDEIFLDIHQSYFSHCNGRLQDPPLTSLIMLIAPGIIATLFLPLLCVPLTTWDTEMPSTLGL
ncbi:receptor activity-modifying protein 1 [Centroberyx gerrardi]|uniref:receptor activity-modifying protein 1 n=1 Tax=Centroberyx gerrardi TaxID=166262 RepID=UPI003AAFD078